MAIAGLDIGSTGAKITVQDLCGNILHAGYLEYDAPSGLSHSEADAGSIWRAVQSLLSDAAACVPDISAVGVTSFGESFVLLDAQRQPLAPVMMYTDPRGIEEAEALRGAMGDAAIAQIAGTGVHPMYTLPKLMWIKKNWPEIYAKGRYVCLIADYIVFMLTGERVIDYSLAARTMGFDVRKLEWSGEIFAAAGIDLALFSRPVPTGTLARKIDARLADDLKISVDLQVVICCHDQVAAAVGSGVLAPGIATDGAGTVQCITPIFDKIPEQASFQEDHYAVIPFIKAGSYCCYAFFFTGGALIRWFTDRFAKDARREAAEKGVSLYEHLEAGMKDEPTGILALPHFAGAGTPYMDPGAQGALVGLNLSHSVSDVYRALMEGIAYEMRLNIEALDRSGIRVTALHATGGGAKSRLWLQLKADILGLPIARMNVDEAGTVGGMALTGVATGLYRDIEEALKALVRPVETYQPRAEKHASYSPHYERYKALYGALRPLMG